MPSGVTESSIWESQVIAPVGGDVQNVSLIRDAFVDVANRTKWLKEGFLNPQFSTSPQSGNAHSNTSPGYFSGSPGFTFSDVKSGDRIALLAAESFEYSIGTGLSVAMDWYDVTNALSLSTMNTCQASLPSGQANSLTCISFKIVGADAASLVIRPRVQVGGTGGPEAVCVGPLMLMALHFRMGQT